MSKLNNMLLTIVLVVVVGVIGGNVVTSIIEFSDSITVADFKE